MRQFIKSPLIWTACILLCILFFSPSLISCRHHGSHDHGLDTVAVNPAFAKDPPVAEDVTIQKLDKETVDGNTLLRATFSTASTGRIGSPYLAFMTDDRKVVLRDDGVSPDE